LALHSSDIVALAKIIEDEKAIARIEIILIIPTSKAYIAKVIGVITLIINIIFSIWVTIFVIIGIIIIARTAI
jgi:hypothetical protein